MILNHTFVDAMSYKFTPDYVCNNTRNNSDNYRSDYIRWIMHHQIYSNIPIRIAKTYENQLYFLFPTKNTAVIAEKAWVECPDGNEKSFSILAPTSTHH